MTSLEMKPINSDDKKQPVVESAGRFDRDEAVLARFGKKQRLRVRLYIQDTSRNKHTESLSQSGGLGCYLP